jgi:hypothetical protein
MIGISLAILTTTMRRGHASISSLRQLDATTRRKIRGLLRTNQPDVSNANAIRLDAEQAESKWHNVRTELDGITFASAHEANRRILNSEWVAP